MIFNISTTHKCSEYCDDSDGLQLHTNAPLSFFFF